MEFQLKLPPSTNELLMPLFIGFDAKNKPIVRLVPTTVAKRFRKHAHSVLPVDPLDGPVELFITFYVPTISSDCNNRIKALEDACNGRLFHDDSQVAEAHTYKAIAEGPDSVGVVFEVKPAAPGEHAEMAKRLARSAKRQRANAAKQPELLLGNTADGEITVNEHRLSKLPENLRNRLKDFARPPASWSELNAALPGQKPPPERLTDKLARLAKPASYPANKAADEHLGPGDGWDGAA